MIYTVSMKMEGKERGYRFYEETSIDLDEYFKSFLKIKKMKEQRLFLYCLEISFIVYMLLVHIIK